MEWAKLIVELVHTIAWPIVVLLLGLTFSVLPFDVSPRIHARHLVDERTGGIDAGLQALIGWTL